MSVLERDALAESPLADLHILASELGIDGYRRLRKEQLVDAIVTRQSGGEVPVADYAEAEAEGSEREIDPEPDTTAEKPRRRRGGRRRKSEDPDAAAPVAEAEPAPAPKPQAETDRAEETGAGTVEVLPNSSAFLRVGGSTEASDGDIYVSAAQVRRCELVSGDRVTGPMRPPRRSERYPSLIRVETINGRPAEEVAEGTRWEDLPAAFPEERFKLGSDDPTVKAIEWLTPFGKGSRVVITGAARAGKSEALRRLAAELPAEDLERIVVLCGVRPEETGEWAEGAVAPVAALHFGISPEALGAALERGVEQGKRIAARGGDAVVLVDTLDAVPAGAARKALVAARNIPDGGSLTVIATAGEPFGGETTVIALDVTLAAAGSFPALDLLASGTLRPERLVGEAGAQAIAQARTDAGNQPAPG